MTHCDLHDHDFLHNSEHGERQVLMVLGLTLVTMVLEIGAGLIFNSMALTADGWHMGTHAAAFGITIFAYRYARKHAKNPRFSFGTGKVSVLGGFASAVALGVVAILMAVESIHRIIEPQDIRFNEAIAVAVIGLVVNLASAFLLKGEHHHHHGHDHAHSDDEDHNLKAAYFHVLADAVTSIAAIAALIFGRIFGWAVLDPVMGIVGSLVITKWAVGLMKETSGILLDGSVDPAVCEKIQQTVEDEKSLKVIDLHVWAVAPGHHAVILSVDSSNGWTPPQVKALLSGIGHLVHVNVEVHRV
ncbi:CDF family Co(II)/Ni(II) efflux transporter DmeF [Pontiella agarivorans]|uniref:CDF family Co(II)/Ni(II) efflux transporter DmeF n=1 Tax=Pontiella agarivorans TaxID=3038953 RepID=A0ABU5MWS3_9BACT|nr:CDF family Co(II)/Ni(II) efflux transporter DmeF [Pontiella agarivorans]MDZ8118612.1 CDF family Co(II)/Ni(II) efflux transporter DmeF [Pontiella agarivorans]